jgi:ABC-type transport system substrate-binding protein
MPKVSADGRTYLIKIKTGVFFQDDPCFLQTGGKGRELYLRDVIYSLKRLADPRLNAPGFKVIDGLIVGLNEWREKVRKTGGVDFSKNFNTDSFFTDIEGLKIVDSTTLAIKLVKRAPQFLDALAHPGTSIVPHEAIEKYGPELYQHPVGTGPFRLRTFVGDSKLVWYRNPNFRSEVYPSEGMPGDEEAGLLQDAGKPLPLADRIVTQVYPGLPSLWSDFNAGKLDFSSPSLDRSGVSINPVQPWVKNYKPHERDAGAAKYLRIDTELKLRRHK